MIMMIKLYMQLINRLQYERDQCAAINGRDDGYWRSTDYKLIENGRMEAVGGVEGIRGDVWRERQWIWQWQKWFEVVVTMM